MMSKFAWWYFSLIFTFQSLLVILIMVMNIPLFFTFVHIKRDLVPGSTEILTLAFSWTILGKFFKLLMITNLLWVYQFIPVWWPWPCRKSPMGGRGCLMSPPVRNLRAVIIFHLTISSPVPLSNPVTLPVLPFFSPCLFSRLFFKKILHCFSFKR